MAECTFKHHDCFSRVHTGREYACRCLTNTYFGDRDCPFYKPKPQVLKEWKEALQRREALDGRRKHE